MKKYIKKGLVFSLLMALAVGLIGCGKETERQGVDQFKSWEQVVQEGSGKTVTIFMWGGNESINRYMDQFVSSRLKDMYDITLKRVPMNASDYLTKLINEKKSGEAVGTGDLLWINAENFLTAKTAGLLDGPFTHLLPNQKAYYDPNASDLHLDSGIPIEGFEAIWGRAQLVFTYDEAEVLNPPMSYAALLEWAKENPGKFSFPKVPEDFVGTAFVRNAYYELLGDAYDFSEPMTKEAFWALSEPVMAYFEALRPFLWNEGKHYPASQAQQDELFKNGELLMTMGFEVGKTSGLVAEGVYPSTVQSYVFETGTIGNAHYLAIPFNAPESAAALLVIDFLQSPEAQIEKMNPTVWGDMPAFDPALVDLNFESALGGIDLSTLSEKRLPEMRSEYIEWIKEMWVNDVLAK